MATHLRIISKRAGFRRAGIVHQNHKVDHSIESLTAKQIEELKNDPMLIVEEVDLPIEKAPAEKSESNSTGSAGDPPAAKPAAKKAASK